MKHFRRISFALALSLCLTAVPVSAADTSNWLIAPTTQSAPAFTDTAGTIAEQSSVLCAQTGLMQGVDAQHFSPSTGLNGGQVIAIAARLLLRLQGGDASTLQNGSGNSWWLPYDAYLLGQIDTLSTTDWYPALRTNAGSGCSRSAFFHLMAAVLQKANVTLPEINTVSAVPDCDSAEILQFYRWGILGGKDAYGTLDGSASLSRAAASAMLARIVDPAQRLTLHLQQLELCQQLLGVAPDTLLMTVSTAKVTAEEFLPTLVAAYSQYNHSRSYAKSLEESGRTPLDDAVDTIRGYALSETLASLMNLDIPADNSVFASGYHGLTAHGQSWTAEQVARYKVMQNAFGGEAFEEDRLPTPTYEPVWNSLAFQTLSEKVAALPYWGGTGD